MELVFKTSAEELLRNMEDYLIGQKDANGGLTIIRTISFHSFSRIR